jgi:serine/threonine-protein kinase
MSAIQSGTLLQQRYRVVRVLGKGGFGQTFEVDDGGTPKVLKVLLHNEQLVISLFQREAEVLSRLRHPGIPRVDADGYFTCSLDNSKEPLHCLVMEKIDGKNLREWLLEHQPITQKQAINWLKQLTEILSIVHQKQYFHRDIKPSNIMLRTLPDQGGDNTPPQSPPYQGGDRGGQLVLIDFGAVREVGETYFAKLDRNEITGIFSRGYTPPEQINGAAVPQSDFFALGRTFVTLLTSKQPQELTNSRTGEFIWRDLAPQVSQPFAQLIDDLMATFPKQRPQTAQMILQRLEAIVSSNEAEHLKETVPLLTVPSSDRTLYLEAIVSSNEAEHLKETVPLLTVPSSDRTLYIDRQPIESRCYKEIVRSGSLIRIKAPRQMGKTSLMNKILAHAAQSGMKTVRLNFRQAEGKIFTDLDKFLRWFSFNVSRQLKLKPMLDEYWQEELMGSMMSCTAYFEGYILEQINSPLVLGLDEVDAVFPYSNIAQDFFPLLRTWHEEANNLEIWQQLRMVVVHSTEVYIPLNINQSPFNVGLPVDLPEFTRQQVQDLARRYGLNWSDREVEQLMCLVGGHPYLVRVALERISRGDVRLEQVLKTAPTEAGIYNDHLRRLLGYLQEERELAVAFKRVVAADNSIPLEPMQAYKLNSLGLVHLQGNNCSPQCNLYRQYFHKHLTVN